MQESTFSPRDLLLANKWSSILFTTYSLSLSFFEAVALSAVARTVRGMTVLTDLEGYRSSLADSGAIGVGRSYDVVPIKVRGGVFHPKVALMADEAGTIRGMVGSGNLTFGGWGYNTELIDVLVPGPDSRAFEGLADFLHLLTDPASKTRLDIARVPNLEGYVERCRSASRTRGDGNSLLLHTLTRALDLQLGEITEDLGGATSLTVVSPFFSAHFGVQRLAEALSCDVVAVAVPPMAPNIFDFVASRSAGLDVSSVTSELFRDTRS